MLNANNAYSPYNTGAYTNSGRAQAYGRPQTAFYQTQPLRTQFTYPQRFPANPPTVAKPGSSLLKKSLIGLCIAGTAIVAYPFIAAGAAKLAQTKPFQVFLASGLGNRIQNWGSRFLQTNWVSTALNSIINFAPLQNGVNWLQSFAYQLLKKF